MGVATETGYTWTNGTHPRLLHNGNRFPVKAVAASADTGDTADLVNNELTVDRWTPFANGMADDDDFGGDAWTATRFDVASDGQTVDEGADASTTRLLLQGFTFSGVDHVFSVTVERQTMTGLRLNAYDGTDNFTASFDLRDGTVDSVSAGVTANVVDLGDNTFELRMIFAPSAGSGSLRIFGFDPVVGSASYSGLNRTSKLLRAAAHVSEAMIRLDTFAALAGSVIAIAAHNLGESAGTVTFEHDSNGDDTWTEIGSVEDIATNAPIMFFFDAITSDRWRVKVSGAALPEVGVIWVGDPLVFERAFYAGASPARMNRATEIIGNMSRTGELMGRSKRRTILTESIEFSRLTYDWVRANLDGPKGAIQSLEDKPAFLAWRPSTIDDCSYLMRATPSAPRATGIKNMWSFGINAEVHGYE